jgi:hypothetical protein
MVNLSQDNVKPAAGYRPPATGLPDELHARGSRVWAL